MDKMVSSVSFERKRMHLKEIDFLQGGTLKGN